MEEEQNKFATLSTTEKLNVMFEVILSTKTQMDQVSKENQKIMAENKVLHEKLDLIEAKNLHFQVEITQLKQKQFESVLTISGIPADEKIENMEILNKIGNLLGVETQDSDIKKVYRVKDKHFPKNDIMVIEFCEQITKTKLLAARRGKSIFTTDLNISRKKQQIYLNQYLVKDNYQLLKYTRKLKLESGFKFVWSDNGQILAKRKEGDKAMLITSKDEVDRIISKEQSKL